MLIGTHILTKNFRIFLQPFQENVGIVSQTRKQTLIPTFFLIHCSRITLSFDGTCIFLDVSLK